MKFSEIPGQLRIKNHLIQTVLNDRISHAQLFTGPSGSGKLALAIAFAQFINCTDRQVYDNGGLKGDSCGKCPSCVKYAKLAHPDLHFFFPVAINKEKKEALSAEYINDWREYLIKNRYFPEQQEWYDFIQIENKQGIITAKDCNEMIRLLGYKSYESEFKVVIIWHAEKIFHSAAPKILKILEEPPDKTLFLLVTENTDHMLNTILSRTQILKIPRYSDREVVEDIQPRFNLTEAEARKIALLCEGDLKLAESLVDEKEADADNFRTLQEWLRLCFKKDVPGLVKYSDELAKIGRERQKALLGYALRVTRRCLLFHYRLDALVKLDGEEFTFVQKLSPFINPANGQSIADEFNKAIFHVERNANPKILFTDLSLKLTGLMQNKA